MTCKAEYRVFQIEIITYETPQEPKREPAAIDSKVLLSNLDPEQYVGYFPIKSDQQIKYTDTWMCPGRTNGKDFCPNPKVKEEAKINTETLENKTP